MNNERAREREGKLFSNHPSEMRAFFENPIFFLSGKARKM